jgi:TRAP-type mannitol/chloroaromatic compound transport system permease small subunit
MSETVVPAARPGRVMTAALAYQRFADRLSEWMGKISQYVVIVTVVVGFVNVVLRYTGQLAGVRLTNNGLIEAQWYLYSLIFLFGFGYILKHQVNVRVDFWFADQPRRRKAWIDIIGHSISLIPFCLIAIWVSVPQVRTSWQLNEQSPDPSGLPRAPIKTMIIVAFVLLLAQAVAEMVKLISVLRGLDEQVGIEESDTPIRIE